MVDFKNQRRLAAELLKCGRHRVKFDDRRREDIAEAVTRSDIRKLIVSGAIYKMQKRGTSRGRTNYRKMQKAKGRRRGQGKRKGSFKARNPKKRRRIMTIRPIRRRLRYLRDSGMIDKNVYRRYYNMANGGMFKSRTHLDQQLRSKDLIGEKDLETAKRADRKMVRKVRRKKAASKPKKKAKKKVKKAKTDSKKKAKKAKTDSKKKAKKAKKKEKSKDKEA